MTAGVPIQTFKVQIVDSAGNVMNTHPPTDVTISLDPLDPRDTLFGATVVATNGGEATFAGLFLKRAANNFRLVATAKGLTGAVSLPFGVSVGTAAKLAWVVQPTSVIAGEKMVPAPQVVVQDAAGNTVPNNSGLVVLSVLTGPSGSVPRNNVVTAVNGVATFDSLRISAANSSYSLQAVGPTGAGLQAAVSNVFSVTPGAPLKVQFTVGPTSSVVNTAINPAMQVAITDSMSNIVTSFTKPVTLQFDVNPTGATLGGTTTVNAVSGVATFSGITIDLVSPAGSGYRLRSITATVPDTARSGFFAIVP
ncbi:MAG: hypothetical protein HY275_15095 [Gemmatimonadetes bacterium]|nr:hypothetical protein [Gemmatimonadota bacterium]